MADISFNAIVTLLLSGLIGPRTNARELGDVAHQIKGNEGKRAVDLLLIGIEESVLSEYDESLTAKEKNTRYLVIADIWVDTCS